MHLYQHAVIETASYPSHINQITIPVQPGQQRAEMFSRSFGRSKSADDEMTGLLRFDLEPVFRASLLVFAFPVLSHNPFEAVLFNCFEKCDAICFHMIGEANPAAVVGK